ncbi:MAG: hypothetical protein U0894_09795 [Pirellulales bacterium]
MSLHTSASGSARQHQRGFTDAHRDQASQAAARWLSVKQYDQAAGEVAPPKSFVTKAIGSIGLARSMSDRGPAPFPTRTVHQAFSAC